MFETILKYNATNLKNSVNRTQYYDSLFITSHLLAANSKQVPRFVYETVTTEGVGYYVDPILHQFSDTQFRNDSGNIRPWHNSYANALEDPFSEILSRDGVIELSDLPDTEKRGLANSLALFQEDYIQEMVEFHAGKYEEIEQEISPEAVLTWRIRMTNSSDGETISEAIDLLREFSSRPVFPIIQVPKRILQRQSILDSISATLADADVSGSFIAFENLRKRNSNVSHYSSALQFINDISESGAHPRVLNGDFFSNILHYFGLEGAAYGTIYGDYTKPDDESSGTSGGMLRRYYVPQIKDFLQVPAAVRLMQQSGDEMCDCEFCSRHFDDWDELLEMHRSEDDTNLLTILYNHALAKRWEDARAVEDTELDSMIDHLADTIETYKGPYGNTGQIAPDKEFSYIPIWHTAVNENKELAA